MNKLQDLNKNEYPNCDKCIHSSIIGDNLFCVKHAPASNTTWTVMDKEYYCSEGQWYLKENEKLYSYTEIVQIIKKIKHYKSHTIESELSKRYSYPKRMHTDLSWLKRDGSSIHNNR